MEFKQVIGWYIVSDPVNPKATISDQVGIVVESGIVWDKRVQQISIS
jgi:hypothetical protein